MRRKATAQWNGNLKEGKGSLTTDSTALDHTQYSFSTRFENGIGTNPEELLAAAHAGCFTMQLSAYLSESGFVPEELTTVSTIVFENGSIVRSELELKGKVPTITEAEFQTIAHKAKENCPVSKAFSFEKTLDAKLG
ncbi:MULTISPECIES: OsmC family protein [Sphingobacterium]|uniref:OsmC family protein n=2 Tax=Sphingobacterium TaxID=28453 RepID=A0ABX7CU39_SPHMU|nr:MULTISPECIES: OsmC family protein [Sphingobacterium]QQT33457.1 OsmC family protein [Sphingobacterium multivorum]QQT55609.1 OsmC family protein [Sphingobacterium multivorum]QRY55691.1 OsmC family protein [Sphingobacterium siyangense]RKF37213.1 OsmC family peroxiredoxin [Sphingobacterium siyangense]